MEIKRTILLDSIYEFSLGGSGLVVGKPGIGKSYLLQQLKEKLVNNNILCFIIKIDNAFDSSDEAIQAELGISQPWKETLNKIELRTTSKAVLIFDAFDAARDEQKRKGFLEQIKKAKIYLKDKWNVIVSVRTYDASKSEDLRQLFPISENDGLISNCRKIEVPELSDEEVKEAYSNNTGLQQLYYESGDKLKEILHVPFFLKLLEVVIINSPQRELDEIKKFKSETQLLNSFWQKKISNTSNHLIKEKFLLDFTNHLVADKKLTYSKSSLLSHLNPQDGPVFEYLRSENVIDETSLHDSRITYSHNIIFDYAVSRLCLDADYDRLLEFVNADHSRPFFLRPSFIYFFTDLWYSNPVEFWDLYSKLANNQQKEIQLLVRLILNGTVASQYEDNIDIKPLLSANGANNDELIRNYLQSLRFIRQKTLPQDIQLLKVLSEDLKLPYLFEFSFLLQRAITDQEDSELEDCGIAARNFLSYAVLHRKSNAASYVDRIASSRGVEVVAKTYGTNIKESRKTLELVLDIIKEPGFDISYFTNLAEYIQHIVEFDADFVSRVYTVIFDYVETSDEKTSMGGGSVVMNLISDRRQDFNMCYYRLEKFFPSFFSAAPHMAMKTGIDIVNRKVIEKKVYRHPDVISTFSYKSLTCTFISDYSSIWGDRHFTSEPEAIGFHIIQGIENLLNSKSQKIAKKLIYLYISQAAVGFLWKLLFQLAAKYPVLLFKDILPLAKVPILISSSETSYEIREFLGKSVNMLSNAQIRQFEKIVFETFPQENAYSIQAILSMFPTDRLQTLQAKRFMKEKEVLENTPPITSGSSVTPYTNEDWLKDQGVDLSQTENLELTKMTNELEIFTHKYLNGTPPHEEYSPFLKIAKRAYERLGKYKNAPSDITFTVLTAIAKTVAISSRDLTNIPPKEYSFVKDAALFCFEYISKYDGTQNNQSPAFGFSPTPRIEASEALPAIYVHDGNELILEKYKQALNDQNGIVRYNAIKSLPRLFKNYYEEYSSILFDRLRKEKDSFNYAGLLVAVCFKPDQIIDLAPQIIAIVNANEQLFKSNNQFVEAYAQLLLWFSEKPELAVAVDTLKSGYKYPDFANAIVFSLFKQVQTYLPREDFMDSISILKRKLEVINSYIEQAGSDLLAIDGKKINLDEPKIKTALHVFDQVIIRIRFALERSQRVHRALELPANHENRKELYFIVKPILRKILNYSGQITEHGLIIGHTAHYFVETLNSVLPYDPKDILKMVADITKYSQQAGYTFDSFSIREIVKLTEKLLADHRYLLLEDDSFHDLLTILDIHINSGWVDALELLWKLDEIFK